MRIALISDIHANQQALDAVLASIQDQNIDRIWLLGDALGRGPNPMETLTWLERDIQNHKKNDWVIGNHDAMVADLLSENEWAFVNDLPKKTSQIHREIVKRETFYQEEIVREREEPHYHTIDGNTYIMVHGCLSWKGGHLFSYIFPWYETIIPKELAYLNSIKRVKDTQGVLEFEWVPTCFKNLLERFTKDYSVILCVGHTHIPMLITDSHGDNSNGYKVEKMIPAEPYNLTSVKSCIVNPGSVGQPRDLDNRASYAILDTTEQTVTLKRISYPWRETFRQLLAKGYHEDYLTKLKEATPPSDTPQEWLEHFLVAKDVQDE